LGHIVEGDPTTGHVNQRVVGQHHIATGTEADFTAGQHHRTGHADAVALQGQCGTLAAGVATGACRGADIDRTAGFDRVHRAGLTGHQRGANGQVAAAVLEAADRVIGALALVHRQAALVVGGDALAGVESNVGKAQGQAVEAFYSAGLAKFAIAKLDALGIDIQAPTASACAACHHRAGSVSSTQPNQVSGVNGRDIAGTTGAIDGRGGQHQVAQQRLAGQRVIGVEAGAAVEVKTVTRRQLQGLQGRCA